LKPDGHRIALKRGAAPESLANKLRNEAGLKRLTYGSAHVDATDTTTIVLELEAPLLTGLHAKYRRIRKLFGPLRFERVVVRVKGAVVADQPDHDSQPAGAAPPRAADDAQPSTAAGIAAALQGWTKAREVALVRLRQLATAINATKDPDTREAMIRLQAVTKNLTPQPATPQAVDELQRYLRDDEVFEDLAAPNPFGLDLAIAPALLDALLPLKRQMAAATTR
jgi:hypothetical protein